MEEKEIMMTLPKASKKIGIPCSHLRKLVKEELVPCYYAESRCYVNFPALLRYLKITDEDINPKEKKSSNVNAVSNQSNAQSVTATVNSTQPNTINAAEKPENLRMITVAEATNRTGLSAKYIKEAFEDGDLSGYKTGNKLFINEESLHKLFSPLFQRKRRALKEAVLLQEEYDIRRSGELIRELIPEMSDADITKELANTFQMGIQTVERIMSSPYFEKMGN